MVIQIGVPDPPAGSPVHWTTVMTATPVERVEQVMADEQRTFWGSRNGGAEE